MAFAKTLTFCCMFIAVSFAVGAGDEDSLIGSGDALRPWRRRRQLQSKREYDYDLYDTKRHFESFAVGAGDESLQNSLQSRNPQRLRPRKKRSLQIRNKRGYDYDLYNTKRHFEVSDMTITDQKYLKSVNRERGFENQELYPYNIFLRNSSVAGRRVDNQGRRQGSSLRELNSRRHQDGQRIQNDQHQNSLDDPDHIGDFASPYSGHGQYDYSKISYNDKIRQLNTKLSDPFYGSTSNSVGSSNSVEVSGKYCDFETPCTWHWNTTFEVLTPDDIVALNNSADLIMKGPTMDADNSTKGHFLYLFVNSKTEIMTVRSPTYYGIMENCKVALWLHQSNMQNASFKVVTEPTNGAPWVLSEILGNNNERWSEHSFSVGRVQQEFRIVLEVLPGILMTSPTFPGAHIAIDNIRMAGCFPEYSTVKDCFPGQLKCLINKMPACINSSRVCDILQDCDLGEDEVQDCDKMPFGSRCSFEDGWCGWENLPSRGLKFKWENHSGSTPTEHTGPETDHTCLGRSIPDVISSISTMEGVPSALSSQICIGRYMYVNMAQFKLDNAVGFATNANMDSVVFNPPPKVHGDATSRYYNSCMIRFYFHQYGKNTGSISLLLIELKDKENSSSLIWWSSKNRGSEWVRADVILPNITTRYYLQFETRRGIRIYSDVAIDDFSMAPECFGINIPKQDLGDYNYWDPIYSGLNTKPFKDFINKTYYELSTCGSTGQHGPNQVDCDTSYKNTSTVVKVLNDKKLNGIQYWTVPSEGYYTIIVHGAGGGLGSGGTGSSRGASAHALLELKKGQIIFALVGQQGSSACIKTLSVYSESNCKPPNSTSIENPETTSDTTPFYHSKTHEIKNTVIQDGGGGGGGATYLFMLNKQNYTPIMVAGGGGGLGAGRAPLGGSQHGRGVPPLHRKPRTGHMYGKPNTTPGAGGGWLPALGLVTAGHEEVRGQAATEGGVGGRACSGSGDPGAGGFGGGGGGCTKGGAGGGWAGGDIIQNLTNGEGGYSFVDLGRVVPGFTEVFAAMHSGPGQVIIIPAIEGCGCDYRCVALDEYRSKTKCICPQGWVATGINQTTCEWPPTTVFEDWGISYRYIIGFFGVVVILLVAIIAIIFTMLYNRYQVRKQAAIRHRALLEQDLRLSRLRSTADDSALTSFNPNYGCDAVLAGGVDVRQLPQVARDSLRLVKALGQGAFGEVYQGLYRHRDGDAIEMPVAVKTLPEMSTGQSETDFLMEAAIMAKFNHPNIVHLIGVCFDRHPRFIVLELLAGGDLKNFLRENRPKPERSSSLGMKDLVLCALDVAKGCRYMETKRFIHRDIAARNCLLTSKGPGRVVKIADFGMARDIYRADYYRKGGKAMLPIKWMPPEAFLDGIFTSKTDVWSFGVLLWEVFSLGIMPYTGCANREVMQMVTSGGRLDIPHGCPLEIYRIMCDCWNPSPQDRPSFSQLFERMSHCIQDPELMGAPLPCFTRALPLTREVDQSQSIQQACGMIATQASDYLVPLLPFANITNCADTPTVSGEPNVLTGQSSSEPDPSHPEILDGMLPSHSSSSDRLLSSSHNNEEGPSPPLKSIPTNTFHDQTTINNTSLQKQTFKPPPEYGNIALTTRSTAPLTTMLDNPSSVNYPHSSKFQPSKSTDRLLASMESAREDSIGDEDDDNDIKEWETTSFIEKKPAIKQNNIGMVHNDLAALSVGPMVDKLISIDTPQQTPTSLQPPDNSLSRSLNSNGIVNQIKVEINHKTPELEMTQHPNSSPKYERMNNYKKINLPTGSVNFVKQRPLCLDAAQLEQNLNALKKNSGSVNLNNMNILPPYVNVLTPNKLSKNSENRKIQIDPKKAIIHDLASPPGKELPNDVGNENQNQNQQGETRLKNSASSNSLMNGPLTDLPYADSDNGSSSSSNNSGINIISRLNPSSKQNNYTEINLQDETTKKVKKQNSSTGGFLNNDSEISC